MDKTKKSAYNIITSFEEIENQFHSHKRLHPTFRLRSDKNKVITRLEEFLENDENSYVVTYLVEFFDYQSKFSTNLKKTMKN